MPRTTTLLVLLACAVAASAARAASHIATLDSGPVRGTSADGVISFKGIPYAAPPVGALRWRAPQPVEAWQQTRDANVFGNACLQPGPGNEPDQLGAAMSEDCLYLNVWRPANAARRLPVMVWFHGGALTRGAASLPLYDGAAFARRGVILVSVNYRVGYPGFFAHPALSREAADGGKLANYGLMDQIAALDWIQRNIRELGGDPRRVTIFGQSAGGFSVQLMMLSPKARGLFHRAIVQSGYYRGSYPRLASTAPDGKRAAEQDGVELLRAIGVETEDVAVLRSLSASQLQALPPHGVSGGIPVVDGQYVVEDMWTSLRAGRIADVPLMIGATDQETPRLPPDIIKQFRAITATFITPSDDARLEAAYGGPAAYERHLISDFTFAAMLRSFSQFHRAQGLAAYRYRFAALPDAAAARFEGLPHSGELPYVFGNLAASQWPMGEREQRLSEAAMEYWVEFARRGKPAPRGRAPWPLDDGDRIMLFDNGGARPVVDDRSARYRALAGVVDPRS
jgi:para-nitrobenzyl esterase